MRGQSLVVGGEVYGSKSRSLVVDPSAILVTLSLHKTSQELRGKHKQQLVQKLKEFSAEGICTGQCQLWQSDAISATHCLLSYH